MNAKNQQSTTIRRKFIEAVAVAATGLIIHPRCIIGGKGFILSSDKVNIAH